MKFTYLRKLAPLILVIPILVAPLFVMMVQADVNTPGGYNSGGLNTPGPSSSGNCSGTGVKICIQNPLRSASTIPEFIALIITNIVLPIGAVVAVLYIMYAGFLMVTARGNASQIEEAKRAFLYAAIGTAILLGSMVIANVIQTTVESVTTAAS